MTTTNGETHSNDTTHAETTSTADRAGVPDYLASPNAVFGDEGVEWRYGKPPDYTKTRIAFQDGKRMNHEAGSLPQLVENLVKNWEVEASFKPRLQDWRTIDHDKYTFAMNGGCPQSAEHMLKVGTYNAIIAPNEYYDPNSSDFASSHKTFKRMMPNFAWEVMEVYSPPPRVVFKWRHWGLMKNDHVGFNDKNEKVTAKAHGGPIEIFGITVADVDDKVRIRALDTWMDPLAMFRQISPDGVVSKENMNRQIDKADAIDVSPSKDEIKTNQQDHHPNVALELNPSGGMPSDAQVFSDGGCSFAGHATAANGQDVEFAAPKHQSSDVCISQLEVSSNVVQDKSGLPNENTTPDTIDPMVVQTQLQENGNIDESSSIHDNAREGAQIDVDAPTSESPGTTLGAAMEHSAPVGTSAKEPIDVMIARQSNAQEGCGIEKLVDISTVSDDMQHVSKKPKTEEESHEPTHPNDSSESRAESLTDQLDALDDTMKTGDCEPATSSKGFNQDQEVYQLMSNTWPEQPSNLLNLQ